MAAAGWRWGDHIYRQVPGSGGLAGGGAGLPLGSAGRLRRLSAGGPRPAPAPAPAAPRGAASRGARLRSSPGAPAGGVRALLGAVSTEGAEPRVRRGGRRSGASTGSAPLPGGRSLAPSGGWRRGGVGGSRLAERRSQRAAPLSGGPGAPLRGLVPGSCCNPGGCGQREPCELGREGRGGRVAGILGHGAGAAGRGLPARIPPAAGHAPPGAPPRLTGRFCPGGAPGCRPSQTLGSLGHEKKRGK